MAAKPPVRFAVSRFGNEVNLPCDLSLANQRLKLTGAAILVFRASTSLQAAPAA